MSILTRITSLSRQQIPKYSIIGTSTALSGWYILRWTKGDEMLTWEKTDNVFISY
ncbi:hypothetical protein K7432_007628 [Basidiobolus ranarum]|uniref:Uncharacterized protein n=1 Tax=Basidiobolus ranarum TaxID=34480 RepID=A0ABR2WTC4_9FUNG